MSDFIEKLREAQRALAETLVQPLWAHIGLIIAAEPTRLGEFIEPIVATDGSTLDPEAVRISYEREIEHQLYKAVEGFTDWAAARIVRFDSFEPQDFPVPSIVDVLSITGEYEVKQGILAFVRDRMGEETSIPLLGKTDAGLLVPDEAALKEWASCYDWGDLFATG